MNLNNSYHILIIDDDEDDFLITSKFIKNIPIYDFKVDWCYNYKQALKHIYNKEYDLYLVDYYLGAHTGLELIEDAIQKCDDPFILLTGKGNYNIDNKAMQAGAVDYISKSGLDAEKLEKSIRYSLQRSHAMKTLRASEIRYRHIFENSPNSIFTTNKNLDFLDANPATSELFECKKEELLHSNLYSFFSMPADISNLKAKLAVNEQVKEEIEIITKLNNIRYCILSFSKETNIQGEIYFQCITYDISNLKKEEKQKIYREKLELTSRFLRTMAHEIRNPLTNIDLAIGQLALEQNSETAIIYNEIITRNSKRIADLITDLLKGIPNIILKQTNLQKIIEESIHTVSDRIAEKKIKLIRNYSEDTIIINADFNNLKIALLNIIINAIEAIPPDKGRLTIQLKNNSSKAILIIHDNRNDVKKENLSLIFEPYLTAKKSGLELGLTIAYNIIIMHGGSIEVTSETNSGTHFEITFPKNTSHN